MVDELSVSGVERNLETYNLLKKSIDERVEEVSKYQNPKDKDEIISSMADGLLEKGYRHLARELYISIDSEKAKVLDSLFGIEDSRFDY